MVTKELFLDLGNKGFAYKYSLSNKRGFTVVISDFGGTILNLWVPDRDGNLRDVVLGLQNAENYRDHNPDFQGATVGRYANRIAGGKFMLDGRNYQLPVNNPPNSLHGGVNNFSNRLWQAKTNDFGDNGGELILKFFSPDGDEGYPADLHVEVKFTVTADNTLIIDYRGESDAPTVINLTNHSYFNLNGAHTCGIDDHYLKINADRRTEVDENLIPTGRILEVAESEFDFRNGANLGAMLNRTSTGFDVNFILNKKADELSDAVEAVGLQSGIKLSLATTQIGVQLYTGYYIDVNNIGKDGRNMPQSGGFCLETQHFADSPNHHDFPSTRLDPGEVYQQTAKFVFTNQ